MKLFNFSFTNEENIIFLLLILIMIIMIVSIINKPTKSENREQNNMWVPYEQFEPIEPVEQPQLELVFPGKSFEAPIIDEPYVINQLEEQQKQINQLKEQVPISSLNNDQILMMSQEPSYNFLPLVQKLFGVSNDKVSQEVPQSVSQVVPQVVSQEVLQVVPQVVPQVVSQEVLQVVPQVVSQEVLQVVPQSVPQVVSQEAEESNYAGFNNEIDYTNVEQTQIPVEQKVTNFNYNKSIEQVNPNDMIDNYSLF